MSISVQEGAMSGRTIFLAKLIGLFTAILAVTMVVNRDATVATFIGLAGDGPALWLSGMIGVAAGLALVLTHNLWSGGAPPILVTLVGWVVLIKSVVVLALPPDAMTALPALLRSSAFFYADAAFLLALGLYLAAAGFKASNGEG
jgi:hypothetical protein